MNIYAEAWTHTVPNCPETFLWEFGVTDTGPWFDLSLADYYISGTSS